MNEMLIWPALLFVPSPPFDTCQDDYTSAGAGDVLGSPGLRPVLGETLCRENTKQMGLTCAKETLR